MVYICQYSPYESVIPRHHVAGVSTCKTVGELANLEKLLAEDAIASLKVHGEFLIADPIIMRKILSELNIDFEDSYLQERHLYLLVIKKKEKE